MRARGYTGRSRRYGRGCPDRSARVGLRVSGHRRESAQPQVRALSGRLGSVPSTGVLDTTSYAQRGAAGKAAARPGVPRPCQGRARRIRARGDTGRPAQGQLVDQPAWLGRGRRPAAPRRRPPLRPRRTAGRQPPAGRTVLHGLRGVDVRRSAGRGEHLGTDGGRLPAGTPRPPRRLRRPHRPRRRARRTRLAHDHVRRGRSRKRRRREPAAAARTPGSERAAPGSGLVHCRPGIALLQWRQGFLRWSPWRDAGRDSRQR